MKEIKFARPLIGDEEKNRVMEVLSDDILVHGPASKEFEKAFAEFTGAPFAVSIASCTAGLHLFYHALGIGPGDEIIVPAQTHTATAHAVEYVGANCVFVDAEFETGNMNLDLIEDKITEKTKAISLVHYLGLPVDMGRLMQIADKYSIPVLEDCALSPGATYDGKHTGLIGTAGCFSFYPVKHFTTAEGGMFITEDEELAWKVSKMRAFGVDKVVTERKKEGIYDVQMLGYNYRMNEITAALGCEQLKKLPDFLNKRKRNYQRLNELLQNTDGVHLFKSSEDKIQSSYYCLSAVLEGNLASKRDEIAKLLREKGVGTSIYYPRPVPDMTYYKNKYNCDFSEYEIAAKISFNSLALPVGPHLESEDVEYVAENFKQVLENVR